MARLPLRHAVATAAEVFRALLQEKYTGAVVFHCLDGVPKSVEYGRPRRIEIYELDVDPMEGLDSEPVSRAHSTTNNV